MSTRSIRWRSAISAMLIVVLVVSGARGAERTPTGAPTAAPAPGPATRAGDTTQGSGSAAPLKPEEIEQVLAQIALYPDAVLAQVLMASTYPLEIVQADRWANDEKNKALKGDALAMALNKQSWDNSVKSLVQFPQVLDMMSKQLDWTVKLGDAFIADQGGVRSSRRTPSSG